MNYLSTDDVIVAKATGDGLSSVDIIRVSGPSLSSLFKKLTKSKKNPKANNIKKYNLYSLESYDLLDTVLISFFKNPESFTGQDVLEINCHGGGFIANTIIKDLCSTGLARHSLPGEFLFRSYYNNKISLPEAEAVNDLLRSDTNIYRKKSLENINGRVSLVAVKIKKTIIHILKTIEHELDFDENEINHTNDAEILAKMEDVQKLLTTLGDSFYFSKIAQQGVKITLIGKPNAGKSSLYNTLLGKDRSIVSSASGTTRDVIESELQVNKYKIVLTDTAGYRQADDSVEKIGIQKTVDEIENADIILLLAEKENDFDCFKKLCENKIVIKILTKSDLHSHSYKSLCVSIKKDEEINRLLTLISTEIKNITKDKKVENHYLINSRQKDVIKECINLSDYIIKNINSVNRDILASMIHSLMDEFNNIIEPVNTNDIINEIFSNFCVGK